MRVYVAGPMRGFPEFNFPAFDSLALFLRTQLKWATVNPADHDRDVALAQCGVSDITTVDGYADGDLAVYETTLGAVYDLLTWDVAQIAQECDGIVLLPGWERSTGAKIERFVAEALGKKVFLAFEDDTAEGWVVQEDPLIRMGLEVQGVLAAQGIKFDKVA